MEKIRKGNTTNILWEIVTKGSEIPYELTGKDLTLYLCGPFKKEKISQFSVSGNAISWTYQGKDQIHSGVYSLMLVENEGKDNMFTADECSAFELVNCSHLEGGESESHVSIETISLRSAISVNSIKVDQELNENSLNPVSNSAVTKGLKEKVDKVVGKGLSSNDFTDDDKEKLDSLENYDDSELLKKVEENEGYISQLSGSVEEIRSDMSTLDSDVGSINADVSSLNTKVDGKADPNGTYPHMTVGLAEDLGGRPYFDSGEFTFRATAGPDTSIKDGLAEITELHGNAVVWNQGFPNEEWTVQDGSLTKEGDTYVVTPNGGYPGISIRNMDNVRPFVGHKVLVELDFYTEGGNEGLIGINLCGNGLNDYDRDINKWQHCALFITCDRENPWDGAVIFGSASASVLKFKNMRFHNLTKMFEAGNEPTTIEEFNARKPIVADEYAYNEGEVIHMTAEGIKSVGDNAWDEQWELGYITPGDGSESDSSFYIRSKNYCRIIGGEEYYLKHIAEGDGIYPEMFIVLYDENHSYVDYWSIYNTERTIQIDSRARYFKVSFRETYGTTYKNDVMISLYHSGWKAEDAKYQPYWEDRLMFDKRIKDEFPDGMSKWDMVYNKNGKGYIVHGLGVVEDMSQLEWYGDSTEFYTLDSIFYAHQGVMCARYINNEGNNEQGNMYPVNGVLRIYDSSYTDAASFKASLAGIPLYYELAEPTIIEYDEPFNLVYRVADFGTEEVLSENQSAPIKATIQYNFNANDTIRTNKIAIRNLERKVAELTSLLTQMAQKAKEVE